MNLLCIQNEDFLFLLFKKTISDENISINLLIGMEIFNLILIYIQLNLNP